MPPAVLDRQQQIQRARRQGLQLRQPAAATGMESWLLDSWSRCLALGHTPQTAVAFEPVSAGEAQTRTAQNQPLIAAARPVIARLLDTLSDTRYFAIVTDHEGIVIDAHGPSLQHDRRARDIARIGVNLSEQAVGTTAISGALAERKPVWLHQGEHYFQSNGIYSCAGAPLIGPQGQCLGMLDLTGVEVHERPELKHLVGRAARQIENAMALDTAYQLLVRVNWPGESLGHDGDGVLTFNGEGFLLSANSMARELLGQTLHATSQETHAQDIFAIPHERLFDMAATDSEDEHTVPSWNGLQLQVRCSYRRDSAQRPVARTSLRKLEDSMIRQAVLDAKGNVNLAAQRLGIGRATVYRRLQSLHKKS